MSPSSLDSPQKLNLAHSFDFEPAVRLNGHEGTREATPAISSSSVTRASSEPQSQAISAPAIDAISTLPLNGIHHDKPLSSLNHLPLQSVETATPTAVVLKDEYTFGGIVNRETDLQAIMWQETVLKPHLKQRKRTRKDAGFGEHPAIVRTAQEMLEFTTNTVALSGGTEVTLNSTGTKEESATYFPELHIASSVPNLPTPQISPRHARRSVSYLSS